MKKEIVRTGVDIPKISNLVFLRKVKSRILYHQMLGRATRRCDEIGKECYRVFESCGTLHYEEFCYIHLQKRAYTGTINNHDCYYVAPDSFIPFAGTVEVCDIREINPYRGKVNELIEEFINEYAFRIKRKFKSFFIK